MASFVPWRGNTQPGSDNRDQASIYRERSAHLKAIADAEPDPILREQLHDLARQYDEIAASAMLRRETLDGMRREFARRSAATSHRAGRSRLTATDGQPTEH